MNAAAAGRIVVEAGGRWKVEVRASEECRCAAWRERKDMDSQPGLVRRDGQTKNLDGRLLPTAEPS